MAGLFDAPSLALRKGFGSCLAPCGAYSAMSCGARRAQRGRYGKSHSHNKSVMPAFAGRTDEGRCRCSRFRW